MSSLLERVQGIIDRKDETIESLNTQLVEKDRLLKSSGEKIQSQKISIAATEKDLNKKNDKVLELENSYQDIKSKLKESIDEVKQLREKLTKADEELDNWKKLSENASKIEGDQNKKIKKLEQALSLKTEEVNELTKLVNFVEAEALSGKKSKR